MTEFSSHAAGTFCWVELASTAKATGLGAQVMVPPRDIPKTGRFSVVSDPQGAMFALFKFAGA